MAISFSDTELLLLKIDVMSAIEREDEEMELLRAESIIVGQPIPDAESVSALVRTVRVAMLRKIEQELDVPFRPQAMVS